MEQTVNQFSKGLLMDSHPMVQSNDTLSDALNATFITMNGNEVILQNDMGNRRVDNAYLPAGYEPVGIKEYGGIIYIAAYNPITNRSLVGSFPSPERKIGVLDDDNLFGMFFENELKNSYSEKNLNGLICLSSDTIQVPITGKNSLHAGDKFVLYSDDLDSTLSANLSNYNNTSGKKIISPKNKKYTISIGILNSLNEFVDITKTLARYENNSSTPYKFDKEVSDLYKFNYGYFICKAFDNSQMTQTVRDSEFIKERNTLPCNTYAYKLVGPMYMLTKLNHIDTFNYNIYGNYNNNIVDLYIEGIATYNCPDGVSNNTTANSDIYQTYETGEVSDFMFDFFKWDKLNLSLGTVASVQLKPDERESSYDPISNTYKAKYVKHYTFFTMSSIFEYVIGVKSGLSYNGDIYLAGLSDKGTLDLNLLGSGALNIKGWRFFTNNNSTTLTYSLQVYPKYEETINYIEFRLRDVSSSSQNSIIISKQPVGNGRQTITIDWEKNSLKERTLYEVLIYYHVSTYQREELRLLTENNNPVKYFILTTDLFNSCYSQISSNDEYIANYCYPGGVFCGNIGLNYNNSANNPEIETFKKKILISPKMNYYIEDKSESVKFSTDGTFIRKTTFENNLPSIPAQPLETLYILKKDINLELKATIKDSLNSYPEFINVTAINGKYFVLNNIGLLSNLDEIKEDLKGKVDDPSKYVIESGLRTNENKILGEITYKDIFSANYLVYNGEIKNVFDNIYNYLNDVFTFDSGNKKSDYISYSGIGTDYMAHTGPDDEHYCYFIYEYNQNRLQKFPEELLDNYETYTIFHDKVDLSEDLGHVVDSLNKWRASNPLYDLKGFFRKIPSKKKIFAYLFGYTGANEFLLDKELGVRNIIDNQKLLEGIRAIPSYLMNRVWWRTSDGEWAVIDKLFGDDESKYTTRTAENDELTENTELNALNEKVRKQMIDIFGGEEISSNIFFCRYKRYQSKEELIIPSKDTQTYNSPYSYDYKIKFKFKTNLILNNTVQNDFLQFGIDNTKLYESDYIKLFNISSSKDFLDIVLSNSYLDVDNIDINTGIQMDSYGNKLLPNNIYFRRNVLSSDGATSEPDKVFTLVYNPPFISDTSSLDDENSLVCIAEHDRAVTSFPVNYTSKRNNSYDNWTWFNLDKVERYSPEKFTEVFNVYTYNTKVTVYPNDVSMGGQEQVDPGLIVGS